MLSGTTKTSGPQSVAAIPRAMSSQRTQTTTHNSTANAATPNRAAAPKRTLAIRPHVHLFGSSLMPSSQRLAREFVSLARLDAGLLARKRPQLSGRVGNLELAPCSRTIRHLIPQ